MYCLSEIEITYMRRGLPNLLLSYALLMADVVIEFAALHVLQDEDDAVLLLEDLVDVHDVGMIEPNQHFYFVLCA
jgi:hypothetical protein